MSNLGPKSLSEYVLNQSHNKANKKFLKLAFQGLLAGMYIAIGAIAYLKLVAATADPGLGEFLGALVFPVGIVAVLLMQAELFTSDTMIMISVYTKQIKFTKILKILITVLLTNLIGGMIIAWLTHSSGIFNETVMALVSQKAIHKVNLPIGKLFFSAILCNIVVSTGVCLAYSCSDTISKIISVWLAITAFVLTGTEHVVANVYYLFIAFFGGADISLLDIAYNLSVAAIGNFIGGGIVVSGINYLVAFRYDDL
ncbi:MAG: formate/nitrite transporter family protein [Clostridiales bacterium]|nr:formate/nitrite transporter family protein [Clostridiales bacterium]